MEQRLFGDRISVIRVPGIKWSLVNVAMENVHRELCKMSDGVCHLDGGECTGDWETYGSWILFDIRKEVKWWNPMTWFLNYYYYYREERGQGETVEDNDKTVENQGNIEYIRLK